MRHRDMAFPSNYQHWFVRTPAVNILRRLFENRFWSVTGQKKQLNRVSAFNRFLFRPEETYRMWNYLAGPDIDFSGDFLRDVTGSRDRIRLIRRYFHKMVKYQGKKRLAFKITGPSRISYLSSIFPDARFVYISRGDIPTINSLLLVKFWKERGYSRLWWNGVYSDAEKKWADQNSDSPALLTALQIRKLNEITREELVKHRPACIEVRYEDFVEDPEAVLERILHFLDLEKGAENCRDYLSVNKIHKTSRPNHDLLAENLEEVKKILGEADNQSNDAVQ